MRRSTTTEYTLNMYGSVALGAGKHACTGRGRACMHWDPPDMQMCDLRCTCTSNSGNGGTVRLAGGWKKAGKKQELICITHTGSPL